MVPLQSPTMLLFVSRIKKVKQARGFIPSLRVAYCEVLSLIKCRSSAVGSASSLIS